MAVNSINIGEKMSTLDTQSVVDNSILRIYIDESLESNNSQRNLSKTLQINDLDAIKIQNLWPQKLYNLNLTFNNCVHKIPVEVLDIDQKPYFQKKITSESLFLKTGDGKYLFQVRVRCTMRGGGCSSSTQNLEYVVDLPSNQANVAAQKDNDNKLQCEEEVCLPNDKKIDSNTKSLVKQPANMAGNAVAQSLRSGQEREAGSTTLNATVFRDIKEFVSSLQRRGDNLFKMEEQSHEFGKGGFGQVNEIVDLDTLQVRAAKCFLAPAVKDKPEEDTFFQELWAYHFLRQSFGEANLEELGKRVILNDPDYDLEQRLIYFQPGALSLKDLTTLYRGQLQYKFAAEDLLYIFFTSAELVLFFYKFGLFHGDIKEHNIVLVDTEKSGQYELKFIDLGGVSKDITPSQYTARYFCSPLVKYKDRRPVVETAEERFYLEMFQVFRTLQSIMLPITQEVDFNSLTQTAVTNEEGQVSADSLFKLDNAINQYYAEEIAKSEALKELLNFVQLKGWKNDYKIQQIEELLKSSKFSQSRKYFVDTHSVISKSVRKRRKQVQEREGVLNKLMGLSIYVPLRSAKSQSANTDEEKSDLMQKVIEFICNDEQNQEQKNDQAKERQALAKQILVLIGQSGGGKSLFLVQLKRRLNQMYKKNQLSCNRLNTKWSTLEFKFRDFAGDFKELASYLKRRLQQADESEKILLLADGFDEFNETDSLLGRELYAMLGDQNREKLRLIVTCRENTVSHSDLNRCFALSSDLFPEYLYICPFDYAQQKACIQNFVEKGEAMKKKMFDFDSETRVEEYLEYFEKETILQELSRVPFTLRMILTNFKDLKGQAEKGTLGLSKCDIYQVFVRNYYSNEFKRIVDNVDHKFKELLLEEFDLEVDDYGHAARLQEQLFVYVDRFNASLSQQLFSEQKIIFSWATAIKAMNQLTKQIDLPSTSLHGGGASGSEDPEKVSENEALRTELFLRLTPLQKSFSGVNFTDNTFLHKSLYEYFMALRVIQNLKDLAAQGEKLNDEQKLAAELKSASVTVNFTSHPLQWEPESLKLFQQLFDRLDQESASRYQNVLWNLVRASRHLQDETHLMAAANAATLLNVANCNFVAQDLSRVKIPNAYLSHCWLNNVNFQDAVLDKVDFSYSSLDDANLSGASFIGGKFGQIVPLKGHTAEVNGVDFSADGQYIISTSGDCTVKLWNVEKGDEPKEITSLTGKSSVAIFSRDGQNILTGSSDGSVRLFQSSTLNEVKKFQGGDSQTVSAIALSKDGKQVASACESQGFRIWDVEMAKEIKLISSYGRHVIALSFAPDGSSVAAAMEGGTVMTFGVQNGERQLEFHENKGDVQCICHSPDGKFVVTGDQTGLLLSLDLDIIEVGKKFIGHSAQVNAAVYSNDGKRVVSGGADHKVLLWDAETSDCMQTLLGHEAHVLTVAISPNGARLISGSADKTVRIWELDLTTKIKAPQAHTGRVYGTAFLPRDEQKRLVSVSADQSLRIWNTQTGAQTAHYRDAHKEQVRGVAVSPDALTIATAARDGKIVIWRREAKQQPEQSLAVLVLSGHDAWVRTIVFSNDGKLLASVSSNGNTIVWKADGNYEQITALKSENIEDLWSVVFSPDNKMLATGGSDAIIKLWDFSKGTQTGSLTGHREWISTVLYTPDGKKLGNQVFLYMLKIYLVSASGDRTIRIWDLTKNAQTNLLNKHTGRVWSIALSNDGTLLASASGDRSVRLWSMKDFSEIQCFLGHSAEVWSVTFSTDGQAIASAAGDACIRVWNTQGIGQTKKIQKPVTEALKDLGLPQQLFDNGVKNVNFLGNQVNFVSKNEVTVRKGQSLRAVFGLCTKLSAARLYWQGLKFDRPLVSKLIQELSQK